MRISTVFRLVAATFPAALLAQSAFDIALIGDMPYGAAAEPRFERVIADINRQNVEFTAHIGDTKNGSSRCDDSHFLKALNWFNSFEKPVIYSVGDNEWTDCMRANNGAYDPLNRLSVVRRTYFGTNQSLGKTTIALERQSDDPQYALYVENAMLVKAPVTFVSIHIPGSNNNREYKTVQGAPNPFYDDDVEFTARNAANIAWLRKAFKTARDNGSYGVMIFVQANMFETFMDKGTGSTHSGFSDFIAALRGETVAFRGEVVMVSGDTHYMRIDKPLTERYPACVSAQGECKAFDADPDARGARILNFTRAEVPGSSDVHWLLCHIRPGARNVFQFEFMILPVAGSVPVGVNALITSPGATSAANTYETVTGEISLSAAASTSSNSGPLTYSWASAPGYPPAAITGADTATPVFQLPLKATYQFTVTVTDRTGASSTATVYVRYV